jgi:hypothetical protein
MALARIITRSHPCSRQLAIDLLGRGYAVEIVSPDSIPDNLADLELRVEEEPGNQLVASVEAHNGDHSASLEFVHFLKAPMPDFIRRPPEPNGAVHFPEPLVSVNAELSAEEVKLPADAPQLAPETVSPAAKIPRDAELDPKPKPVHEDGARLTLAPGPPPTLPVDPPNHIASASSVTAPSVTAQSMIAPSLTAPSMPRPATFRPITTASTTALPRDVRPLWNLRPSDQFSGQFPGSFRNVAVAMALMLALVFGFGTRRNDSDKAAAPGSGAAAASIAKASIVPEKTSGTHQGPAAASKPAGHLNSAPKESPIAEVQVNEPIAKAPMAKAPTAKVPTGTPTGVPTGVPANMVGTWVSGGGRGEGLIARDTVTYLDKRTFDQATSRAKVSQSTALSQPVSGKHDGVIAENSVTVLNSNPAPKAAKPDSGIKRYSDLK